MPNKSKSRIAKPKLATKQRIKPWMVSIFVALIVVVGAVVVYRSFAAELPQSVIDEIKVEVMIDGRAKVTVKSLNYEKIFNQGDTAKALADPAYYNVLMNQVLSELKALYEKKNPPPSQPPTTPPPITPAPTTPSPVQPNPSQPSPSQTPSPAPSQNPSTPSTPDQPNTTPSGNIENQDKAKEAITSLEYDLQDPSTMTTYNGVAAFILTPTANIAQADTIGIYVDKKLVKAIKPTDKEFGINTARLENGVHRLDVVVFDKSDTPLARYVYMFNSENNLGFVDRLFQPILGLFGL